jgi:hypothetical protein
LPLHLWTAKSLEAIGNSLGRFISIDKEAIATPAKKVARVLVELDIHEGLLESIDIEWRNHLTCQKLDYLGIPFRCTFCRRTGHLRKHCTGYLEEELLEGSMLDLTTHSESLEMNSHAHYPVPLEDEVNQNPECTQGRTVLLQNLKMGRL